MSTHILENEYLKVTVADVGAELISVYDKQGQRERIWTADPNVWNRHAPILFPFVGKVVAGKYRIGDREYAMKTQHGFARDMEFTCVDENSSTVAHRLIANEQTRVIYPYAFQLTVRHILDGRQLRVEWSVANHGNDTMYFSIGGHPGFMLPEGIRKEDCYILFPGMDAVRYRSVDKSGYALPESKTLMLNDDRARYQEDIPDTWIFEDNQVQSVGIAGPDGQPYVMMNCEQFPMLAVWANPKGLFICLEPWFGRSDDEGFSGTIDQKKEMQALASKERTDIAYIITFC